MKLFANPILLRFEAKCSKFRHSFELRGFLPFVSSIDLGQRWDNWRKIAT